MCSDVICISPTITMCAVTTQAIAVRTDGSRSSSRRSRAGRRRRRAPLLAGDGLADRRGSGRSAGEQQDGGEQVADAGRQVGPAISLQPQPITSAPVGATSSGPTTLPTVPPSTTVASARARRARGLTSAATKRPSCTPRCPSR
jgi:hypothetical protein